MKKTVILGIFIGAIGLIGPKIIGSGVNEKIDDFVGALNKTPGYEATIVSSQSSWFSTGATVKIGLDPAIFGDLTASPEAAEFFEDFSINAHAVSYTHLTLPTILLV